MIVSWQDNEPGPVGGGFIPVPLPFPPVGNSHPAIAMLGAYFFNTGGTIAASITVCTANADTSLAIGSAGGLITI